MPPAWPLGVAQPSPAPLALVLRPLSTHADMKTQRKLRSYSVCWAQLAGFPRGEAHFAEKCFADSFEADAGLWAQAG